MLNYFQLVYVLVFGMEFRTPNGTIYGTLKLRSLEIIKEWLSYITVSQKSEICN